MRSPRIQKISVYLSGKAGFTLNIPDPAMGLTFLAIGVTMPDIVIGVISTRRGHPDMAMSNAIASNIVEILVGLGLPWLVKTLFLSPGEPIALESRGESKQFELESFTEPTSSAES